MERPVKLAVIGAGLIGKRHIEVIMDEPEAELVAIVDPAPAAGDLALKTGVIWVRSFQSLIEISRPDDVIIATPNQIHAANGIECAERRAREALNRGS